MPILDRLKWEVDKLREKASGSPAESRELIQTIRTDPTSILTKAGIQPDPWQREVVCSATRQKLLNCSRQSGKSLIAAALALRKALVEPYSLILLLSPSLRQSGELFRDKLLRIYRALGSPLLESQTQLTLCLRNGSRIISLPENEEGIRCYSSVSLLVIDEASRVAESLYLSVRPMLAVSRGSLIAMSTPYGRRGWFYKCWLDHSSGAWEKWEIPAFQCPRLTPEFLAGERRDMGDRWFRQEYGCSFEATQDFVFDPDLIDAAFVDKISFPVPCITLE